MKTFLALSFFLSLSAHAFVPKGVHCKEIGSGMDDGYEAFFSQSATKVSISEQTIRGPQNLALLQCSGDKVVSCVEPELRDAGYTLTLEEASDGKLTAELFAVTFAGTKPLAELACRRLNSLNQ